MFQRLSNRFTTSFRVGLFVLLACSSALQAEVYVFRDEEGRVHLSDTPVHPGYEQVLPQRKELQQPLLQALPEPTAGQTRQDPPDLYTVDDTSYGALIQRHAARNGLDPNLVRAVIKVESDFDPRVVSRAGARGLMQLMPGTAKDLGVRDSFDPDENIGGGCRYLRQMLDRFGQDLDLALAAYNAGPGQVEKAGRKIPDIRETRNYVRKVRHYLEGFRRRLPTHGTAERTRRAAILAYRRGQTGRALQLFRRAIAQDPGDASHHYNIGWLYAREGHYQKAMRMYRAALALDPFMKAAYYNLAVTCERRGEIDEAIRVWNQYIEHESDAGKVAMALEYIHELEAYRAGQ